MDWRVMNMNRHVMVNKYVSPRMFAFFLLMNIVPRRKSTSKF